MSAKIAPMLDPAIAGKQFIARRQGESGVEVLLVPREHDGLLVLPGLNRFAGERRHALVARIAATVLGADVYHDERAGSVLNEGDHPVPLIQQVYLVVLADEPARGRWVAVDQLTGLLAPEEWAMVYGGLDYFLTPPRERVPFTYKYQGVATAEEAEAWKQRVRAEAISGYDPDYIWEIQTAHEEERYFPERHYGQRIQNRLRTRVPGEIERQISHHTDQLRRLAPPTPGKGYPLPLFTYLNETRAATCGELFITRQDEFFPPSTMQILLVRRGQGDVGYTGIHMPGKYDLMEVPSTMVNRIARSELGVGATIQRFLGIMADTHIVPGRGPERHEIYDVHLEGEPVKGEWYRLAALPDDVLDHHLPMIYHALAVVVGQADPGFMFPYTGETATADDDCAPPVNWQQKIRELLAAADDAD